jgi:hypothetical protein
MDLKGALVNAGLATKEQVEEAEKKAKQEEEKKAAKRAVSEHIDRYPTNRYGKKLAFAKWFIEKKLPDDAAKRCFFCGDVGLDAFSAFDQVMKANEEQLNAKRSSGEGISIEDVFDCGLDKAREIGEKGLMLSDASLAIAFENPGALRFFTAKGVRPKICLACVRFSRSPL